MAMPVITLLGNNGYNVQDHPEPEAWVRPIRRAGLKYVEFYADLLDPLLYGNVIGNRSEYFQATVETLKRNDMKVECVTTGRLSYLTNCLSHPYADMREEALRWLDGLAELSVMLGGRFVGGHFDYISMKDLEEKPEEALQRAMQGLLRFAERCARRGLEGIFLEQMYMPQLKPYTIREAEYMFDFLNQRAPLPFHILVDTGHAALVPRSESDHTSRDKDPCVWLSHRYPGVNKLWVHCQQTDRQHTRHWPFTSRYNRLGFVAPDSVVQAASMSGADEVFMSFEINYARGTPITQINGDMKVTGERFRRALHKAGYREKDGRFYERAGLEATD